MLCWLINLVKREHGQQQYVPCIHHVVYCASRELEEDESHNAMLVDQFGFESTGTMVASILTVYGIESTGSRHIFSHTWQTSHL